MNISHEVLTRDTAYEIASLDSKLNSASIKYADENCFTYYIALNTWYYQIAECDEWAASAVLDHVRHYGLLQSIKDCDSDATRLVKGDDCSTDIGKLITSSAIGSRNYYFGRNPEKNHFRDDLATTLQLLRYLKRFSPNQNNWVKEEGIINFIRNENYLKLNQRREYPVWLVKLVKDEISKVLDWESFYWDLIHLKPDDFIIPTGATYEGYTTVREKVNAIYSQEPERAPQPFGLPYIFPLYAKRTDQQASRVQAVPKSYKASRIIAMEPVIRQSVSQFVLKKLMHYLPECIDISDQSRNQELAWQGSISGGLATLDASNASDLISKTLFRSVIPSYIVKLIDPLFSGYTEVKGKRRQMQMMSTAGHSLTFVFETIIYYGIAAAACSVCAPFNPGKATRVSVYGDDVVISSEAAQTAIEFYSMLGLKINEDKSYISGPYRESCGEEYYNGINVSSTYYPRFPVVGSFTSKSINLGVRMYRDTYRGKIDDSTTMLVDLQKRLFGVSYKASLFLWEVLREIHPKLTSSKYGSICNDLWAATDLGQPYNTTSRKERGAVVSSSVIPLCDTRKHSYASIRFVLSELDKAMMGGERAFDLFRYQAFLRNGPSFSDPLLELLGVSDPPISVEAYAGKGTLVWRYSIE